MSLGLFSFPRCSCSNPPKCNDAVMTSLVLSSEVWSSGPVSRRAALVERGSDQDCADCADDYVGVSSPPVRLCVRRSIRGDTKKGFLAQPVTSESKSNKMDSLLSEEHPWNLVI
jgi:hypothetical protein